MLNILINLSNLKKGGSLQVATSFVLNLNKQNNYFIVLSKDVYFYFLQNRIFDSIKISYRLFLFENHTILKIFSLGNRYLDFIVIKYNINSVLTLFGPSYWRPKVFHLMGFARPNLVLQDSPFFNELNILQKTIEFFYSQLYDFHFRNNADLLFTENEFISQRVKNKYKKGVVTITNSIHDFFYSDVNVNNKININRKNLMVSNIFLTVSVNYPHKNLKIIPLVIKELINQDFNDFKFILTINKGDIQSDDLTDKYIVYLGPTPIKYVPYLYSISNFLFMPTLLECFSASYLEAMFMKKPILTSDLNFAHSICGNSAMYFDPLNPQDISKKVIQLVNSKSKQLFLIEQGVSRIKSFDDAKQRANKIVIQLENNCNK